MKRFGDAAFPYALFFIGLVVGTERIAQAIVMTPIHETGHVIAAFASGGYGAWDIGEWNLALTYGGNDTFITVAGVFGEVIIGLGLAMVLIVFRRWTFLAGVLFMGSFHASITAHTLTDWNNLSPSWEATANQTLQVMSVLVWVLMSLALALSIAISIVKSRGDVTAIQKKHEHKARQMPKWAQENRRRLAGMEKIYHGIISRRIKTP